MLAQISLLPPTHPYPRPHRDHVLKPGLLMVTPAPPVTSSTLHLGPLKARSGAMSLPAADTELRRVTSLHVGSPLGFREKQMALPYTSWSLTLFSKNKGFQAQGSRAHPDHCRERKWQGWPTTSPATAPALQDSPPPAQGLPVRKFLSSLTLFWSHSQLSSTPGDLPSRTSDSTCRSERVSFLLHPGPQQGGERRRRGTPSSGCTCFRIL